MLSGMSPVEADIYIKDRRRHRISSAIRREVSRSAGERPAETAGTGARDYRREKGVSEIRTGIKFSRCI